MVSLETYAFQWWEVELAKPFLTWRKPIINCVARRWTLSGWLVFAFRFGEVASITYSKYDTIRWDKGCLDSSDNDRLTMISTHLAVFAASQQCNDELMVALKITRRPLTQITAGIKWLASAAERNWIWTNIIYLIYNNHQRHQTAGT